MPKEDSTPPVMKMILLFTSPLLYLAKPNVKVKSGWRRREKRRAQQGADFRADRGNLAQRHGSGPMVRFDLLVAASGLIASVGRIGDSLALIPGRRIIFRLSIKQSRWVGGA